MTVPGTKQARRVISDFPHLSGAKRPDGPFAIIGQVILEADHHLVGDFDK